MDLCSASNLNHQHFNHQHFSLMFAGANGSTGVLSQWLPVVGGFLQLILQLSRQRHDHPGGWQRCPCACAVRVPAARPTAQVACCDWFAATELWSGSEGTAYFCHRHFCPRQVDEAQGGSGMHAHQEEDQSRDCTTQMIHISGFIVSSLFSRVQSLIDYCSIPSHTDFIWLPLPLIHRSGCFMKSNFKKYLGGIDRALWAEPFQHTLQCKVLLLMSTEYYYLTYYTCFAISCEVSTCFFSFSHSRLLTTELFTGGKPAWRFRFKHDGGHAALSQAWFIMYH